MQSVDMSCRYKAVVFGSHRDTLVLRIRGKCAWTIFGTRTLGTRHSIILG